MADPLLRSRPLARAAAAFLLRLMAGNREHKAGVLGILGGLVGLIAAVVLYGQYDEAMDAIDQLGRLGF